MRCPQLLGYSNSQQVDHQTFIFGSSRTGLQGSEPVQLNPSCSHEQIQVFIG